VELVLLLEQRNSAAVVVVAVLERIFVMKQLAAAAGQLHVLEWSIRMEQRMPSQRDPVGLLECDLEDRMSVSPSLEKNLLLLLQHRAAATPTNHTIFSYKYK
jgi:hypothetical protein